MQERYLIHEPIGQGAGGVIHRAWDQDLRRDVALKLLARDGSTVQQRVRFVTEAQIPAQLEHPNIIPIHDVGRMPNGDLFYVMKRVEGGTLKQLLAHGASRDALLDVLSGVCGGVAFAHHRGVIHRDLKPSNVMVGAFGEALVVDWGLARPADGQQTARDEHGATMTLDGDVMGSLGYMAAEQARGEVRRQGPPTDVHALGGILYEVLAGIPPRHCRSLEALLPLLDELPPPPDASALSALALRCLAPDPDARPQDAGELLSLMEQLR